MVWRCWLVEPVRRRDGMATLDSHLNTTVRRSLRSRAEFLGETAGPTRRETLRALGAGLVGWATLAGVPADAQVPYYNDLEQMRKKLPPGIANCRSLAIKAIYGQIVAGLWNTFGRLTYRMASRFDGYYDEVIVASVSRKIEPAWYVTREMGELRTGYKWTVSDPQKDVPQIFAFDEGISLFYGKYARKGTSVSPKSIEDKFVHSIAYAAFTEVFRYATEQERCLKQVGDTCVEYKPTKSIERAKMAAQEYLRSDSDGKRNILMRMERAFQGMGKGDIKSADPLDPYNRKLVAAWAGAQLSFHYWESGDANMGKRVTDYIEMPLIDSVGYNITPFKGQPLYHLGVKLRTNVGYTERKYFERKKK